MGNAGSTPRLTARQAGLVACRRCGQVHLISDRICKRCGGTLVSRDPLSNQRVWAWLAAGMIAYVPANIYPILLTSTLVDNQENTILGGVIDLVHHQSYFVAFIVFFASIVIPISKFMAIAYLVLATNGRIRGDSHRRHRLYDVVEFIGRWSMIDVFVVAILSALVQLDAVATINPGVAAVSFALSVVFTMRAAQCIDPRLIWDADRMPA